MEANVKFGVENIHFLNANLDTFQGKPEQKEHVDKVVKFLCENVDLLRFVDLTVLNNLHHKLISQLPTSNLRTLKETIASKLVERIYAFAVPVKKTGPLKLVCKNGAAVLEKALQSEDYALQLVQRQFHSLHYYPKSKEVLEVIDRYAQSIRSIVVTTPQVLEAVLAKCPNIEELQIWLPEEKIQRDWWKYPKFEHWRYSLEISDYSYRPPYVAVNDEVMKRLLTLPHLKHLRIVSSMTAKGMEMLGQMSQLESLKIERRTSDDESLLSLFAIGNLRNLRSLKLSGFESVWSAFFENATQFDKMPNLEEVSLQSIYRLSKEQNLFHAMLGFQSLRRLKIQLKIGDVEMYLKNDCDALALMPSLEIYTNRSISLLEISSLSKVKGLKEIHLGCVDTCSLNMLKELPNLETLSISTFDPFTLSTAEAVALLPALKYIDLTETLWPGPVPSEVREYLANRSIKVFCR